VIQIVNQTVAASLTSGVPFNLVNSSTPGNWLVMAVHIIFPGGSGGTNTVAASSGQAFTLRNDGGVGGDPGSLIYLYDMNTTEAVDSITVTATTASYIGAQVFEIAGNSISNRGSTGNDFDSPAASRTIPVVNGHTNDSTFYISTCTSNPEADDEFGPAFFTGVTPSSYSSEIYGPSDQFADAWQIATPSPNPSDAVFDMSPDGLLCYAGGAYSEVTLFTLAASPSSLSIPQTENATTTVTITDFNSFDDSVTLSVLSGMPTGMSAAFATNPATSTSVLTISVSGTCATGTYDLVIQGVGSGCTAQCSVSVVVSVDPASFTLLAAPNSPVLVQGQSGLLLVDISGSGGFDSPVTLSVTGLPEGVTGSFSPNPATSTSILTLVASDSAAIGTVEGIDIHGVSGDLTADADFDLTIVDNSPPEPNNQYFRRDEWVRDPLGRAVAGAQIFVCGQPNTVEPGTLQSSTPTPLVTTYADANGKTLLAQPVLTDNFGHASFYVSSGTYTLAIYWSGVLQIVLPDQLIGSNGVGSINLETEGFLNQDQSVENLIEGLNISLTADSFGGTTIAAEIPLKTDGTLNADQTTQDLLSGTNIELENSEAGTSINTSFGLLQTKRVTYTVTSDDLTRGYLVIPIVWSTVFADASYTLKYTVQSTVSGLNSFEASAQNVTPEGFNAIVWGQTGSMTAGTQVIIHCIAIHD